jgi:amino-acid N-acetyltransferase
MQIITPPPLSSAVRLLDRAGLPSVDLTEAHLEHFFAASVGGVLAGLVGVELYGAEGLLRSLVVVPEQRTQGVGSRLVTHVERYASEQGVRRLFLLTTTAQAFFASRGYAALEREAAPASIRATREFSDICPASSAFMVKTLRTPAS